MLLVTDGTSRMVHGGMTIIKYLLFLFNFVFWLSGIGLIVVGAVIQIKYSSYVNFLGDDSFLSAPIMFMVVGCIIAILGFFGCCGAIRENYCMTMTFAVLLGVIFILELAAGIASYVLRNDVEELLGERVKHGMENYNQTGSEGVTMAWDALQREFKCCGTNNYTDWYHVKVGRVPKSCCHIPAEECSPNSKENDDTNHMAEYIHTEGCIDGLKDWVVNNVAVVGGVACGVAVVQLKFLRHPTLEGGEYLAA
ncbi:CD63 antigen [Trichuris trichiura]|uniref:Tetraspanin n=1 Tax=Trichuris trichiura TaxID=36087 RepID=A0A077Z764_TRITR|nr:CD63 antigen [Trichuris trichiura]